MRSEDKVGYVAMIFGILIFFVAKYQVLGLAIQFIALYYFSKSVKIQLEEKKEKQKISEIMKTDFADETKMILLGVESKQKFLEIKKKHGNNKSRD